MPAPYSNLETKLEAAAKLVLTNATLGYQARAGLDSAEKVLPAALLHGEKGAEAPLNSGNYRCKLTITVMDNADTVSLDNHREGAGRIFDTFLDDGIAATLSAAVSDFTCLQVFGRDGAPTRVEDRQYTSEISLDLYCCATDIDE